MNGEIERILSITDLRVLHIRVGKKLYPPAIRSESRIPNCPIIFVLQYHYRRIDNGRFVVKPQRGLLRNAR